MTAPEAKDQTIVERVARKPRLTLAHKRLLLWMGSATYDRPLCKCHYDANSYGSYGPGGKKFTKLAARKTVDSLVATGLVAWRDDCPPDQRVMLTSAGFRYLGRSVPRIVTRQENAAKSRSAMIDSALADTDKST